MNFTAEHAKAFRDEYAALCKKYGLWVTSCGCCDCWIEDYADYEDPSDLSASHYDADSFGRVVVLPAPKNTPQSPSGRATPFLGNET